LVSHRGRSLPVKRVDKRKGIFGPEGEKLEGRSRSPFDEKGKGVVLAGRLDKERGQDAPQRRGNVRGYESPLKAQELFWAYEPRKSARSEGEGGDAVSL